MFLLHITSSVLFSILTQIYVESSFPAGQKECQ